MWCWLPNGIALSGWLSYFLSMLFVPQTSGFDLDLPKIEQTASPKEIQQVSDMVGILYKIVRTANEYFYAVCIPHIT